MKIYFDLAKKCLKVDTENQAIFTGDVLVSKLEVISSAPTTDYYVVVSAKLSNGRTIGPFLYDAGGVQTDSHCTKWTFTLSSANGFTLTKGIVNFYVWLVPVNANDLNKKCIGAVAVNVGEAYGFEDSYFVELDSESQDVIANMSAQIHQLQTLIQNVNIIVPNPTDEATQILDKIKIGSVTYRFRSDYNELTNQPIKNVTLGANTTINDLLQAVDYDETLGELNTSYLLKIKGIFSSPYDSKYLVGMSVRYYNNAVQNVILSQVNGNVVYSGTWSASDFEHTIYNPTSSTTYTFNEFLKYTSQSLTDAQKQQAQANIGVKDVIDAVNYNVGTDVMRPQVDEVNFADVDEVKINAVKTMLIDDNNEDEALLSSVLGGLDDDIADLESGKAKKIVATINNTTYVMTISLYADAEGTVLLSTATVDLPLESIVTSATYYDSYTYGGTTYTKVIVLVLSTTSVPTIVPVGDLISGLQTEITAQNKLSSDLVDDSSSTHKFVTADDKLVWNAKQNALTFDNIPTSGSNNPVKSSGVYSAIDSARQQATQDAVNILTSDNSFVQANLGATPVPDSIVELNGDLYSLWGVGQYKFNENTKQWESTSIPIGTNVSFARADILGGRIFKINNSYYCAFNDATKGVAYLTDQMHWVQATSNVVFDGATVWTDGTDTYAFVGNVSNADDAIIYRIFETSPRNLTLTDVTSSFTNIPTSYSNHKIALTKANIWHDLSGNTFLSYGKTYKLIANSRTFDDREYFSGMSPSISQGNLVWNDGHNVFLTTGNTYVLNMTTETSTQLPIAGMESMNPSYGMYGNRIWKDLSGNVYYVDNSLHQFALVNGSFIDQAYDPTSKNAQSGIAVAEAVEEAVAEIEENFTEADTDITDTTLYKISGVADSLALPKKSQVEIIKVEGNSYVYNQFVPNNSKSFTNTTTDTRTYIQFYTMIYNNGSYVGNLAYAAITETGLFKVIVTSLDNGDGLVLNHNGEQTDIFFNSTITAPIISGHKYYIETNFTGVNPTTVGGIAYNNLSIIDLTKWFNGNIPSDLLDNPSLFRSKYYIGTLDYNAGEIIDADTTELESCGINMAISYDDTVAWRLFVNAILLPNTNYYFKTNLDVSCPYLYIKDSNNNVLQTVWEGDYGKTIGGFTFETNSNVSGLVKIECGLNTSTVQGLITELMLNYGTTAKPHEDYTHDSVNVGSDVLRSVGSIRDVKTADGSIIRKVGVVDLGSLNWVYITSDTNPKFQVVLSNARGADNWSSAIPNALSSLYETTSWGNIAENTSLDKAMTIAPTKDLSIVNRNYTDATAFKQAMSGVMLYYELVTPTTEQGTPFSSNALAVEMYGAEYQNGTTPLQVTKNYDISIKDQVLTNVEVDKKQSEQIKALQKLLEPTLLWANSNPSSDFAATTLTISNLSNYKYLIFTYAQSTGGVNLVQKVERKDGSFKLFGVYFPDVIYYTRRTVTISSTSVAFADCMITETGEANSQLIPIAIYGTDIL